MASTMFQPQGVPLRAKVSLDGGWQLDLSFTPGRSVAPQGRNLAAHELAHVVQNRAVVEARHVVAPRGRALAPSSTSTQFLPEVDDEVLVGFQCAVPRSTALHFNPTEFTLTKSIRPAGNQGHRGSAGMVREGQYRIVILRKGTVPLVFALVAAGDGALTENVQAVRIG